MQGSREEQYEQKRLLNNTQEETLISWINDLTGKGLPPSYEMLRNFAKEISGEKPGKQWPYRFLKRHQDKLVCKFTLGMDKQ